MHNRDHSKCDQYVTITYSDPPERDPNNLLHLRSFEDAVQLLSDPEQEALRACFIQESIRHLKQDHRTAIRRCNKHGEILILCHRY